MQDKSKITRRAGLFEDVESAENAYNSALKRGYKQNQINILMTDSTRKKYYDSPLVKTETGDKSMEGLALGGALGGTVLGVIGAAVALTSTIVIPGLGLVIAGPLAAGLIGAGAGSIAGGFIGALIGAGFPEEHATIYEAGIKKGDILLSVDTPNEDKDLLEDWKKNNGKNIY
jgi:hypothetical protein